MQRLTTWFTLVAAVLGVSFAVFTPPFASPDEATHFFRAYQLSQGRVFAEAHDDRAGGRMPASVNRDVGRLDTIGPRPGWSERWELLRAPTGGRSEWTGFQNTVLYPPLTYAPQTVAIGVGRALGLSTLALMYLARLANVAAFVALAAYAARRFPRSPWLVFAVALLPGTLFLAGSVSPDAFTLALCAVVLAEAVRADRPWVLLGASVALALAKPPYFLVSIAALVVWLVRGRRSWSLPTATGVSISLAFVWSRWADHIFVPYRPIIAPDLDVRPHAQQTYLLEHPLEFFQALGGSIGDDWKIWLGQALAPFGNRIDVAPALAFAGGAFLVAVLLLTRRDPMDARLRATFGVLGVGVVLATAVAVYLYSNAVGADRVGLFYGRYLIPVLPALLVLAPRGRSLPRPALVDSGLLLTAATIGTVAVFSVT
jgi:uncharacterized membrane protein